MNQEKKEQEEIKSDIAGEWSDHFEQTIRTESIRAKAILSACYMDELLNQLLTIVLKPNIDKTDPLLDGANAPLGTFSSKIELAFRMGAISNDDKKSLHLVRKIRNRFAHELSECTFEDNQILNWNQELHNLNDRATLERRRSFSPGPIGDFEKSVSWLIYWIKHIIAGIPTSCPRCGSEMEHRKKIKCATPE
jgi:DNA-binding MltR family transcriptional regulator